MNPGEIVFRPARGCRYTQREIDIIGPELIKLARKLKVDLPQLSTREVKDALSKDLANPLWEFIDSDPDKAMDAWIRSQLSHMISSVRYEYVDIPTIEPQVLFQTLSDTSLKGDGGTGRARILAPDAFDKVGITNRIGMDLVKRISHPIKRLRDWVNAPHGSPLPRKYLELVGDLDKAMVMFAEADIDIAAE